MRPPVGAPEPQVPGVQLAAYASPAFPMAMLLLAAYVYLPTFYAERLGVPMAAIGGWLLLTRVVDVATDPAVGWLSDRWRGRLGRRRPWILAGVPVVLVAVWKLFVPEPPVGPGYLFGWTLLLSLGWTLITVPLYAWGAELSDHYHQRSRIAAWRQGVGVAGTVAVIVLSALPGLVAGTTAEEAQAIVALVIGVTLPAAILTLVLLVPEPQQPVSSPARGRAALLILWRNHPLRRLVACSFVNALANALPGTLFLLFVGHVLDLDEAWAGLFLLAYFAACIVSMPLWLRLSFRWGKHRTWGVSILLACASFPIVLFLGPGDALPFLVMSLLTGFALGADLAFPSAIQADVVDSDTLANGAQRAGMVFAVGQMTAKLALALAVGIAFPLLAFAGFDAGGGNDPTAIGALVLLYGLVPVALKLIALALVWNFPIDAAEQARLRTEIQNRAAGVREG